MENIKNISIAKDGEFYSELKYNYKGEFVTTTDDNFDYYNSLEDGWYNVSSSNTIPNQPTQFSFVEKISNKTTNGVDIVLNWYQLGSELGYMYRRVLNTAVDSGWERIITESSNYYLTSRFFSTQPNPNEINYNKVGITPFNCIASTINLNSQAVDINATDNCFVVSHSGNYSDNSWSQVVTQYCIAVNGVYGTRMFIRQSASFTTWTNWKELQSSIPQKLNITGSQTLSNNILTNIVTSYTNNYYRPMAKVSCKLVFQPDNATIVLAGLLNTLNINVRCNLHINGVIVDSQWFCVARTGNLQSNTFDFYQPLKNGDNVGISVYASFSAGSISIPADSSSNTLYKYLTIS